MRPPGLVVPVGLLSWALLAWGLLGLVGGLLRGPALLRVVEVDAPRLLALLLAPGLLGG
ncbi:hypothetical protein [Kribbella swartbergensis]